MNRTLPFLISAAVAFSSGSAGVAHAAATAERAPKIAAASAASKRYVGKVVQQSYGPVQVKIVVAGKRMTKVSATAPEDRPQSRQINQHAVPILVHEALRAQSVRGVHKVSGASLTTNAFLASLATAMAKAHLPGA